MTGLVNHLWQSVLFACGAWAFSMLLRRNRAAVRYGVWTAASMKFFVPLAGLVALGSRIRVRIPLPALPPAAVAVLAPLDRGLASGLHLTARALSTAPVHAVAPMATSWVPDVVVAIWCAGSLSIVVHWLISWRSIARVVRAGTVLQTGREAALLRRLAGNGSIRRPLTIVLTNKATEPGVFGVVRPVVVWPSDMSDSLSDAHVAAILEHELAHVRRRDNLWAVIHMLVESAFWFCPPVWWIGSRLVAERERACDEDVLDAGSAPVTYAESILLACQRRARAHAWCLAGVHGSHLQKRIRFIMTRPTEQQLGAWKIGLLAAAVVVTFTGPVVFGLTRAQAALPRLAPRSAAAWDVATADGHSVMYGFSGRDLLRYGYDMPGRYVVDGPGWIDAESFEVSVDVDGSNDEALRQSIRRTLEDRFGLQAHVETRDLPVYAMVVSNTTLATTRIHDAAPCFDCDLWRASGSPETWAHGEGQPWCGGWRTVPSGATYTGVTMTQLAASLATAADRDVIDRTGVGGRFDAALDFFPPTAALMRDSPYAAAILEPLGFHSLITAARDQLGLALVESTAAVDVLVIDRMTRPYER